jgi:hypothetical protein
MDAGDITASDYWCVLVFHEATQSEMSKVDEMIGRLLLIMLTSATTLVFGQDVKINLVILRNEKLAIDQISAFEFTVTKGESVHRIDADYIPGELSLSKENFDRLVSDSTAGVRLLFNLNTFDKQKHYVLNVKNDFPLGLLSREYLVLNVFDFRDKKYRQRYGYLTKDNFISEFSFPGSGTRLIPKE